MKKSYLKVLAVLSIVAFNLLMINTCAAQANEKTTGRADELKQLRFGMFICWSFSTFSGHEWTPGVDDISFFNPTGFDPAHWCNVAKEAEMNYILFLTKHHDGFCLWDTATTDRKVTKSPLGVDVLAEVKKACDRHGLKLALYFSEGDWSWSGRKDIHTSAARPEIKKAQLKELLTQYGPIEFIWFDHAIQDGGLSHEETVEWVHQFQPDTFCGFNSGQTAGRLDLRERGMPGEIGDTKTIRNRAHEKSDYSNFEVAEFTYPILEGQEPKKLRGAQWFYSLPENDQLAVSAEKIYNDYLGAERYGNLFSLNIGPDRSGKLRDIDVKTLREVGRLIRGEKKTSAWIDLFNGENLDGWTVKIAGYDAGVNHKNTYRVEDGILKVSYDEYETFDGKFGHLFYRTPFSHYLLRLEYRFVGDQAGGGADWAFRNSGVMIHSQSAESMGKNQNFPVSIEIQALGGDGEHERSTGNLCTPGTNVVMDGKLRTEHCISSTSKTYHGDQWVALEIEVRGSQSIKHSVNGQTVMAYEQPQLDARDKDAQKLIKDGKLLLEEGYIALQAESHPVEFRKVQLKLLDAEITH